MKTEVKKIYSISAEEIREWFGLETIGYCQWEILNYQSGLTFSLGAWLVFSSGSPDIQIFQTFDVNGRREHFRYAQ